MNATTNPDAESFASVSKGRIVGAWVAQLVTAGILAMAAITKFATGSPELSDGLGVGRGVVMAIGGIEILAAALLLIPRLHFVGAVLAAGTMVGALISHATALGFSGDVGGMWPLAIVALAGALVVLWMRRAEAASVLSR